jgi:ferredoxin-NADP reductase
LSFAGQHAPLAARLLDWREIAPQTRHFTFEIVDRDEFAFVPGQFLSLTAAINEKEMTRAYSIAGVPDGNKVEFCLNLVQDGKFSPYLFALQPGDVVDAKGPYGGFIFRQPVDTLCIATGTGIAPFRGMLRKRLPEDPGHQYTLVFGARHEHGLLYLDELEQLAADYPNFRLITTLTRPPEFWTGRPGRVQAHVFEAIGERRDLAVYLCGLKAMVDEVRNSLREMGFDRKQIIYEKYD